MNNTPSPLSGPPPAEIPLEQAPLIRVIAQTRFPLITSIEKRDFIAPFQESIRRAYPVLRPEQNRVLVFGPDGVTDSRSGNLWRFLASEGDWRVTLAPDFLALETTRYTSRTDFLDRLGTILKALADHIDPQLTDRLGVRYIDRITGDNLRDLPRLVRPEVAGVMAGAVVDNVHQSITESIFTLPDGTGNLKARWGIIPPDSTVDPSSIEAVDTPSWLLDLDAFRGAESPFEVAALVDQARGFAERIYTFFRWTVTEEFLRRYGAAG